MAAVGHQEVSRERLQAARRGATELLVIVVGVLLALAADRWNQDRDLSKSRAQYLLRLEEEIRADSTEAARVLAALPHSRAVRDSLLALLGPGEPPSLVNAFLATSERFRWNEPVAWTELTNAGLLGLIDDLEMRRTLSEYYAIRHGAKWSMDRAEERGRGPYMQALYYLGVLDRSIEVNAAEFLAWPQMRNLLRGLGGHFTVIEGFAPSVEEAAGHTLQVLEARTP